MCHGCKLYSYTILGLAVNGERGDFMFCIDGFKVLMITMIIFSKPVSLQKT